MLKFMKTTEEMYSPISDGKFSYFEKGEGPNLVLVHGLFGALSNFSSIIERFSVNHKILIPVLPIYSMPILKANIKNLTKYLQEFLAFKGVQKANLLGNSLGGHIGLIYASMYPDKVNSLVLTGSSGLYENAFGGSFPRREDKKYLRKKIEMTFYNPAMVTDELVDECHEAVNNREKVIRILSIAKSAIRHNMKKELPNMQMPACLIWGKNDTITPPEVADEFHELMPNSELHWLDQCGHAPMMERPEEFNALLENFSGRYF